MLLQVIAYTYLFSLRLTVGRDTLTVAIEVRILGGEPIFAALCAASGPTRTTEDLIQECT